MKDFVAIDFETANRERTSICSVGLVRVENGGHQGEDLSPDPALSRLLQLLEYPHTRSDVSGYGARGSLSGGLGRHLSGVGGFAVGSP